MKIYGRFVLFLFAVLWLFLSSSLLFAQSTPAPGEGGSQESSTGVGSAVKDRETLDQFDAKFPGKLKEIDSRLAEALTLYYDGQYGQALPIFNAIASEVETTDIMWWIGTSAMNAGDLKTAARKFEQMLEVDATLNRVRLELAAVYFQMGQYKESKRELSKVMAANPPEEVKNSIARLLKANEDASRRFHWNVRLAFGVQSDSNVSAGPDSRLLATGSGGTLNLLESSAKVSDTGYTTNLSGNILYNFSDKQLGLAWHTGLDYYSILYSKYSQFNYGMMGAATGPWWIGRNFIIKFPVGYRIQYFGDSDLNYLTSAQRANNPQGSLTVAGWLNTNGSLLQNNDLNRLSYTLHFDPNIEYFFNKYFSLKYQFGYYHETFASKWDQDTLRVNNQNGFDNNTRIHEVTSSFYFFNRQHILSVAGGYEVGDYDERVNCYDNKYYAASYYMKFPTQTELFFKFQRNFKDFKDRVPLYNDVRYDTRNIYTAVLSQSFLKHFFASLVFNYIQNDSNTNIYEFDKQTYTLSVGAYF
jgi:tetratricopeptide (TPR) repeat protein